MRRRRTAKKGASLWIAADIGDSLDVKRNSITLLLLRAPIIQQTDSWKFHQSYKGQNPL